MQTHNRCNKRWNREEDDFIKTNYKKLSVSIIAKQLERSSKATRNRIERLDIKLSNLPRNQAKLPRYKPKRTNKGWSIDSYGRKQIRINGRYVAEHRKIIEDNLGRRLLRKEQIHHINCDKTDNRIENLHLFNNASEHLNSHRSIEKLIKELMERNIIRFNCDKGGYELCNHH